jgi:hypothetical protein
MADIKKKVEPVKQETTKELIEKLRIRDSKLVKGIFKFLEAPNSTMKFSYKKYKGDSVETYELEDGKAYTIPIGVAKHLNKNCWYPEHYYKMDEKGQPTIRVEKKIKRCSFQSMDFMDTEDNSEDLNIVSSV